MYLPRAPGTLILADMHSARIRELDGDARRALARKDARTLRLIISRLGEDVSPRLLLVAISAAHALDAGDVLRALYTWDIFADACLDADGGGQSATR
jgi:hypothetical protein